ncbi:MAG: Flp pilus assembly complex ATPase component TadA [Planctomycetes bacterium]|nr:Flp pilus assembly complex ATPase component TadA [Planctomycetota bacterium]
MLDTDQWYFEIGDGQTYGPFPLDKLRKWAAAGNLMPTHRVRRADSSEWTIAAYVPGLELTTADTVPAPVVDDDGEEVSRGKLGALVQALSRKRKPAGHGKAASADHQESDIIALCDELLEVAYQRGASDLHIDPEENITLIQLRVDGVLEPLRKLPKSIHAAVVSRYKVLSKMDIAERRMAQDGRFFHCLGPQQRRVHIRAAILPTTHGERLTLRLLAVETELLTLNRLGMSEPALRTFAAYTAQKQGMILLSGPTGSGKSTTLYAALRHRLANHPGRFITVEEPVEFDIVGVAQIEVDTADKVRFDTVLRNILRSDPDVIMIGEIRDFASADVAIKAALTGHLVFSSIHTNSAAGVVTRLIDMGLEPFQVAATVRLCVAQRLARRLCIECRRPRPLSAAEAAAVGRPDAAGTTVYDPGGCEQCNRRGYKGRIGLFELLPIDEDLARRIVDGANEADIARRARERKIPGLRDDAASKLLDGATSFDEIVAVSAW